MNLIFQVKRPGRCHEKAAPLAAHGSRAQAAKGISESRSECYMMLRCNFLVTMLKR
jgi:hypothetical protein